MDNKYPAKPRGAPQTGRVPQSERPVADFLMNVQMADLRGWLDFAQSPLYVFMVSHFEKMIRAAEKEIGSNETYYRDPLALARKQGEITGTRKFEVFFKAVKSAYDQRVATELAQNQSDR